VTDRHFFSSLTRISDLETGAFEVVPLERAAWGSGDYVVCEVYSRSLGRQMEVRSGRSLELAEADLFVGALGVRHATLEATGSWEAVEDDGFMEILTGGGLVGRLTSRSLIGGDYTRVVYRGHVCRDGRKVTMSDFVPVPSGRTFDIPTIMIIGTSMSAGKTTAARVIVRRLVSMGLRVGGAKVTGAGRYRDVLSMSDAGASWVLDFVDVGLPSSICPEEEVRSRMATLMSLMADRDGDVAVVEVGASPLEPYNGAAAVEMLEDHVELLVLCASDPYAVVGVMEAFGRRPDLITGITSNTDAGIALAERLSGVPCLNVRDRRALPALDALLRDALALGDGSAEPGTD